MPAAFLEHDDFNKARRALFIASVLLIALTQNVLDASQVKIAGLVLSLPTDKLILAASVSVVYLAYVFGARAIGSAGVINMIDSGVEDRFQEKVLEFYNKNGEVSEEIRSIVRSEIVPVVKRVDQYLIKNEGVSSEINYNELQIFDEEKEYLSSLANALNRARDIENQVTLETRRFSRHYSYKAIIFVIVDIAPPFIIAAFSILLAVRIF